VLIEIRKAGFVNKGAQLMLLAILQEVRQRFPSAQFAMAPSRRGTSQPLARIREQGILAKASLWRARIQWGDLAAVLPSALRTSLGLVLDRDIDVVLDAAGFAYGNPWPNRNLTELAHAAKRWQRRGASLVLLPQAFGEFTAPEARQNIRLIADRATLIYARDSKSLANLQDVLGDHSALRLAPDFTSLLPGHPPEETLETHLRRSVAIVPNARMLDKTDDVARTAYLPFLQTCIRSLRRNGLPVALVVHGGAEDAALAKQLRNDHPYCEIIIENDPQRLKGLLGACRGSIGSRYHGLISCLNQGVPAFGTSWSHKYQALYSDYDFEGGMIDPLTSETAERACTLLANDDWILTTREHLYRSAESQKRKSIQMWRDVFSIIDTATRARSIE
jgi:polysaccharide pyruvyl transferase WcaK-like protein